MIWFSSQAAGTLEAAWQRHTIDSSSRGADGVKLADVNGDGLLDITTGWEEGSQVRVYLHPGHKKVHRPWPKVTVGQVHSPEDAILTDIDRDGNWDVISSCEGKTRTIFVHWAPPKTSDYLHPSHWETQSLPITTGKEPWMFVIQLPNAQTREAYFIAGSKNPNGSISLLSTTENPRKLQHWRSRRLYDAGWIMSLRPFDMDLDGDLDVLASDRNGPKRCALVRESR